MASEDIPNSLADAEKLLNQHQQLKDEIDAYAPEYAKMKDFGDKVTEGQEDPQYMFLRQVYKLSTWVLYIFHDLKQWPEIFHENVWVFTKYMFCFVLISTEITSSGQWMGGITSDVGKQTTVALSELKPTGRFI